VFVFVCACVCNFGEVCGVYLCSVCVGVYICVNVHVYVSVLA